METQETGQWRMRGSARGVLVTLVLLLALAAGAVWALWERCGLQGCPDVDVLNGYIPDEASVILDRDGAELGKLYRVRRSVVPLDSLPAYVPQAFIAVEDQRFWEHDGVDWRRVVGAAWANVRAFGIEEGFSTITMQLARNVFPDRLPHDERTLSRKLAEMRVAREIEERYTKRQILELYLNQIYFGSGAWGIEAAAREYFGRPATELTLSEAALLAGLIRAPSRLNPRINPAGARARRDLVLMKMMQQGMITPARAAAARAESLDLERGHVDAERRAPYFLEELRQRLEAELGESIYTEGYTIHTTLDADVQAAAEEELRRQLDAIEAGRYGAFPGVAASDTAGGAPGGAHLQGAVVVLDVETGDVLALVGGRDFEISKFDRATQSRRQPGSAFKPFVYTAALEAGYPPTYPLHDAPLRQVLADGTVWTPQNFGGGYAGTVTLRNALVHSRNIPTVRLAERVGIDRVIDVARRLGLTGPIPAVPSIALGSAEVSLLEMVAAYAAFATLGERPEPRLARSVEDRDGRVIWSREPRIERVLDPAVAFLITDLLRDVVDRGTGTAVRAAGFRGPAAGKTGTTNGATDVWFLGYTPRQAAGVWIGFDAPRRIVRGATGGRLAAPVWGRIMRRIAVPADAWRPPPGIVVRWVDETGRVIPPGCNPYGGVRREYFLAGTAPRGRCHGWAPPAFWPDSAGPPWPDSGATGADTLGIPAAGAEGGWWSRLRRRIFGSERDARPGRTDGSPELPDSAANAETDTGPPDLVGRPAPPGVGARPRPSRRPEKPPVPAGRPRDTTRTPPDTAHGRRPP
ncbi:MAG TPA: PBP1A family penicillin-binding protein [Longimicrobiales bacterium]